MERLFKLCAAHLTDTTKAGLASFKNIPYNRLSRFHKQRRTIIGNPVDIIMCFVSRRQYARKVPNIARFDLHGIETVRNVQVPEVLNDCTKTVKSLGSLGPQAGQASGGARSHIGAKTAWHRNMRNLFRISRIVEVQNWQLHSELPNSCRTAGIPRKNVNIVNSFD